MIFVVGQPMPLSINNPIGLNNSTVMAFQRNSMIPSVSSYPDSALPHNISNEDMISTPIQGIAYITVLIFEFALPLARFDDSPSWNSSRRYSDKSHGIALNFILI